MGYAHFMWLLQCPERLGQKPFEGKRLIRTGFHESSSSHLASSQRQTIHQIQGRPETTILILAVGAQSKQEYVPVPHVAGATPQAFETASGFSGNFFGQTFGEDIEGSRRATCADAQLMHEFDIFVDLGERCIEKVPNRFKADVQNMARGIDQGGSGQKISDPFPSGHVELPLQPP